MAAFTASLLLSLALGGNTTLKIFLESTLINKHVLHPTCNSSTMDTTAVATDSGHASRNASTRGRKSGTRVDSDQRLGCLSSDEKVSESHEQERHVNAKTFFHSANFQMDDMGLLTPAKQTDKRT